MMLAVVPFLFLSCTLAGVVPRADLQDDLPDTYMIKFKQGTTEDIRAKHTAWIRSLEVLNADGTVARGLRHEFDLAFDGYSAVLDRSSLDAVRNSPEVAEIRGVGTSEPSENSLVSETVHYQHTQFTQRIGSELLVENNKGWNANRLSHRDSHTSGYQNGPWIHDEHLGQGVDIFVLDTGINVAHPGFRGSYVHHEINFVRGTNISDNNGHGTMCAGVIAGAHAGLSPLARTHNIKIANDQDRSACDDVVAGLQHVVNSPGKNNMKVVSLSQIGFTGKPDVSEAVTAAVKRGVHVVVCAGNSDVDACHVEPANAPGAIVVGSIDGLSKMPTKKDSVEGTNVGKCVTIFAPGSRVPTLSAKNTTPGYQYFAWGTSIAAPQVASLIANRLSKVGPQTPQEIRSWLVSTATKGQIKGNLRGSPNLIAFSGIGEWDDEGGSSSELDRAASGNLRTVMTGHNQITADAGDDS